MYLVLHQAPSEEELAYSRSQAFLLSLSSIFSLVLSYRIEHPSFPLSPQESRLM